MCDISKPTKFKTKTVYKVCEEVDGNYYSVFAGYPIEKGPVTRMSKELMHGINDITHCAPFMFTYYDYSPEDLQKFNVNIYMMDRVSGFGELDNALILHDQYNSRDYGEYTILEIVIAGEIMEGTSMGICPGLNRKSKTYAGKEIISFKPIKTTKQ